MFHSINEAMAPTTRSASAAAASQQQVQEMQTEEISVDTVKPMEEVLPEAAALAVIKGFKIADNARTCRYGVGVNSLEMLKTKAKLKFPNISDMRVYLATDGSEVTEEEYFSTLEPQTLFIIAGPDIVITTDADYEFDKFREQNPLLKVSDIIHRFMEKHPEKFSRLITEYEKKHRSRRNDDDKTHLSLRSEHAEWFMGQEEKCQTKEEALSRKAQDRVRAYYYKTKDELTRNLLYRQNANARKIIDSILQKFRYLLIGCDYFSMLFDRSYEPKHDFILDKDDETDARAVVPNKKLKQVIKDYTHKNEILDEWTVSLCTDLGIFYCQGAYSGNRNNCPLHHSINPYTSRENLVLFQVWNLDHQIELSRTILPSLLAHVSDLVDNPKRLCQLHKQVVVDVSVLEYFLEIFSLKNLKLVHVVCHEKVQRQNYSNGRLLCKECHEYKIVEELMSVDVDKDEGDL